MLILRLVIVALLIAIGAAMLIKTAPMSRSQDPALTLILNSENSPGALPKHFRMCTDPWLRTLPNQKQPPSRLGLDTLNASGSGQFSENGLKEILARLKTEQPIIIVDLRQESHGFANGIAISWYATHDTGNVGKTLAEIEGDEAARLQGLLKEKNVTIQHILSKPQDVIAQAFPQEIVVENVATEQKLTKGYHLGYIRIPVTDHLPPSQENVERFLAFVNSLAPNTWLHFHCEAGDGRTTTFLCLYDMLKNSKEVSFQDIIERQYLLGGINLSEMPARSSWKYPHAVDRLHFLEQFYNAQK